MNTFTPSIEPQTATVEKTVKTITSGFGDGYEQVILDGINPLREEITLSWPILTVEQCNEMDAFFKANMGQTFYWTVPGQTQKMWQCGEWQTKYDICLASCTATLREMFA